MSLCRPADLTQPPSVLLKAYGCLLVVYLVWGTTMGAMHVGVATIPPALMIVLRFVIAGGLLVTWCRLRGEAWPSWVENRQHAVIGLLLFTAGNAVTVWAVQYIPTSLGAVLVSTTPFWMIGLASLPVFKTRERLALSALIGIALGFSGIVILLWPQLQAEIQASRLSAHLSPVEWLSVVAILSTSMFWSVGSLYKKRLALTTSVLMGLGLQNLWAALGILPFLLIELKGVSAGLPGVLAAVSPLSWMALGYLIVFGTIIATPCYFYILKHLPVPVVSTFAYVTPMITILVGWRILGEPLTSTMLLGASVIFLGVILVQISQVQPAEPK